MNTYAASVNILVDSGPQATGGTIALGSKAPVNLTQAVLAQVTSGYAGDTETISAIETTGTSGLTLTDGTLTYSGAPPPGGTAEFRYTVISTIRTARRSS